MFETTSGANAKPYIYRRRWVVVEPPGLPGVSHTGPIPVPKLTACRILSSDAVASVTGVTPTRLPEPDTFSPSGQGAVIITSVCGYLFGEKVTATSGRSVYVFYIAARNTSDALVEFGQFQQHSTFHVWKSVSGIGEQAVLASNGREARILALHQNEIIETEITGFDSASQPRLVQRLAREAARRAWGQ
ncbi:MAG TPA: hypothetical protein VF101_04040 [Gaiellaceae bacterium]